jgi:hypothetical protein
LGATLSDACVPVPDDLKKSLQVPMSRTMTYREEPGGTPEPFIVELFRDGFVLALKYPGVIFCNPLNLLRKLGFWVYNLAQRSDLAPTVSDAFGGPTELMQVLQAPILSFRCIQ